jgi:hypothetical protein
MKADPDGLPFSSLYPVCLKKKQTCIWVTLEQNIIARNVVDITDTYLMMGQNRLENVIATMACV